MLHLLLVRLRLVLFPLGSVQLIEGHQLLKGDVPILMWNVAGDVGEVDKGPDRWLVVVVGGPEGV